MFSYRFPSLLFAAVILLTGHVFIPPVAQAGDDTTKFAGSTAAASQATAHRYMLGLLDDRSIYGHFWFPEPLLGPEMDVDRELRVDYFHSERRGKRTDEVTSEFEYAIGQLTLEAEIPYQHETEDGQATSDLGSIELAARHPIYQYVSSDGVWDNTFVAALEIAIPTKTQISRDTEIVPKLAHLLRIGKHLSIQTTLGYSMLIGPDEGGAQTLEYNATFGYKIDRDTLPLPGIESFTPMFELSGERDVRSSKGDASSNRLFGVVGARFDFQHINWLPAQLRPGIGYVFPIDTGAKRDKHWGVIFSLVFEY